MQTNIKKNLKIPEIKGKTLSLQESHQKAGVENFMCSDFFPILDLLAEGECNNPDEEERNAKVVITDLKTGLLKGWYIETKSSLFSRRWSSNKKGTAITRNEYEVLSVEFFMFNGTIYLGVSGDGSLFEVFDVSHLKTSSTLGNCGFFLIFFNSWSLSKVFVYSWVRACCLSISFVISRTCGKCKVGGNEKLPFQDPERQSSCGWALFVWVSYFFYFQRIYENRQSFVLYESFFKLKFFVKSLHKTVRVTKVTGRSFTSRVRNQF